MEYCESEIQVVNKENILKTKSYNSMACGTGEEKVYICSKFKNMTCVQNVYLFSSYKLLASFKVSIVLMLRGPAFGGVTLCDRVDIFQINVVP